MGENALCCLSTENFLENTTEIGNVSRATLSRLKWPRFTDFKVYSLPTIADGSCLIHSILQGFSRRYGHSTKQEKQEMTREIRIALADRLLTAIPGSDKTYYDILSGGCLREFSEHMPSFTATEMQKLLRSSDYLGYGFLEFLGLAFGKDIYILSLREQGLYITDEYTHSLTKNRESLVLLYRGNHFETVLARSRSAREDTLVSQFSPNHEFIKLLQLQLPRR